MFLGSSDFYLALACQTLATPACVIAYSFSVLVSSRKDLVLWSTQAGLGPLVSGNVKL